MKSFVVEPLAGIRDSVRFGMSRDEARSILAPAVPDGFSRGLTAVDGFFGATLQVSYDSEGRVEFIEFARDSGYRVLIENYDVFGFEADAVIAHLKKKYPSSVDDPEPGYSFCFPDIEVGFWRSVLPDDGEEGRYFESVGFGRAGYYSARNG